MSDSCGNEGEEDEEDDEDEEDTNPAQVLAKARNAAEAQERARMRAERRLKAAYDDGTSLEVWWMRLLRLSFICRSYRE